jgi:regulatory protein
LKDAEQFLQELGIKQDSFESSAKPSKNKKGSAQQALQEVWDEEFLQPFEPEKGQREQLQQDLQNHALRLLGTREHGDKELLHKLRQKFAAKAESLEQYGISADELNEQLQDCLAHCRENNWQSDERYIEQLVSSLLAKGQGPMKIRQKAQQKSSRVDLLDAYLDLDNSDWLEQMRDVLYKKYGANSGAEGTRLAPKDKAKQMRFLQSRGYRPDLIWRLFR